jgi:hypothetical protein
MLKNQQICSLEEKMDEKMIASLLRKNRDVAWRMARFKGEKRRSGFRVPYEHNDIELAEMLDDVMEIQKEILTIILLQAQQG